MTDETLVAILIVSLYAGMIMLAVLALLFAHAYGSGVIMTPRISMP